MGPRPDQDVGAELSNFAPREVQTGRVSIALFRLQVRSKRINVAIGERSHDGVHGHCSGPLHRTEHLELPDQIASVLSGKTRRLPLSLPLRTMTSAARRHALIG